MRVSSYAVARPAFYDRNAAGFISSYNSNPGPHGETTRVTVTVAAGKKHSVEVMGLQLIRDTAPSATVFSAVRAYITPSGGTSTKFVELDLFSTVVNTTNTFYVPPPITLYPADVMIYNTVDSSTGGTITYNLVYKSTIFDA